MKGEICDNREWYAVFANKKKDFVFLCYDFFFCLIEKYYLCIH